jgi:hypothetical protein
VFVLPVMVSYTLRGPDGVGTNISGGELVLSGGNGTGTGSGGEVRFITAAAGSSGSTANTLVERAAIRANGAFQVGGTTTSVYTQNVIMQRGINEDTVLFISPRTTGSQNYGLYVYYSAADPNGTGNSFFTAEGNGTIRAQIRSNGGLANYSANDVNLSDRREKTNFAPAKNYIDQSADDPGTTLGVVAQDVQAVAPELVMESNWGTELNPRMRLSIYQTDLQYALMKSIQELKAELDSVKAELATLKGN